MGHRGHADRRAAFGYSARLRFGRQVMDERRKRLRYRAWRRGFREADLILGRFADARLETLGDAEVMAFEALLDAPDQDVYEWVAGLAAAPEPYRTPLLDQIRAFAPEALSDRNDPT